MFYHFYVFLYSLRLFFLFLFERYLRSRDFFLWLFGIKIVFTVKILSSGNVLLRILFRVVNHFI